MKPRATLWTIAKIMSPAAALPAVAATCSLGKGETPTCDPTLPPTEPNACHQVSLCDRGDGFPKAEHGCCMLYANFQYSHCSGIPTDDFNQTCAATPTDGCCVAEGTNQYQACMEGRLGDPDGGTGGNAGTGGSGGSAGTGGSGGSATGGAGGAGGAGATGGAGGAGGG